MRAPDAERGAGAEQNRSVSLFSFRPAPAPRWPGALQAGLGIAIPIAVMTLLGAPALGYIGASGAFTVIFAGALAVVERARILPIVAAGLVACAGLGALVAHDRWLSSIGVAVVAILSAALMFGFRMGPPGPIFFILVFGLSAQIVSSAAVDPGLYVLVFAAGCALSLLIALTPLLLPRVRRVHARPLHEIFPGPAWNEDARMLLIRVALVSVIGVAVGAFVDPRRGYWIVGSAVAVIGLVASRKAAFQRGIHRMVGTILGAGVYALLALAHPSGLWLALLLGVLQFLIEMVVVSNYALALLFITPLVLTLTGAANGELGSMVVAGERIVDTFIGAVLGMASGVLHPRTPRVGAAG